ncbi:hypothetical protein HUU61_17385 [Rhodopseudomonas palustris]|uniref:hypothetical protein n=1 Tax=Rhodopseudomonas pseudopalustris TaxID=1513892 RepID=UPI00179132AD|nr:hypothetical protein [Rhodopseudomonas palustris]
MLVMPPSYNKTRMISRDMTGLSTALQGECPVGRPWNVAMMFWRGCSIPSHEPQDVAEFETAPI